MRLKKVKTVFIWPDRPQTLLVEEFKRKKEAAPGKYHFIKGGKVCMDEKTVN